MNKNIISPSDQLDTYIEHQLVDDIEKVRAQNNTPWMDLIRLGLELDPERTKEILRRIHSYDRRIWELLDELAQS